MRNALYIFLLFLSLKGSNTIASESAAATHERLTLPYVGHPLYSYMEPVNHRVLAHMLSPIAMQCRSPATWSTQECNDQYQTAKENLSKHGIHVTADQLKDSQLFAIALQSEAAQVAHANWLSGRVKTLEVSEQAAARKIAWDAGVEPMNRLKAYGKLKE